MHSHNSHHLITATHLALCAAVLQLAAAVRPTAPSRADHRLADVEGMANPEDIAGSLAELAVELQEADVAVNAENASEPKHSDVVHMQNTKNMNTKSQLQRKVAEVAELLNKLKFLASQQDRRQSLVKQRKITLDLEKVRKHIKETWKELHNAEKIFKTGKPGTFEDDDDALLPRQSHGARATPMRRMDGGDDLHFEDEGGTLDGNGMNATMDAPGGKAQGAGRSNGEMDHARCCRCGPYWVTPFDTAIWSASGQCNLQCEQLFHTEPDEAAILPAPKDCHTHARMAENQQRSDCRDECRDVIWRHFGKETFPEQGPHKCTGSGCKIEVDPDKLQKLFDHAEDWWKKNGRGDNKRPAGQCDTWLKNDVCKRSFGFMEKACPGKCPGSKAAGTVDEHENVAKEHAATIDDEHEEPNHTDEKAVEEEEEAEKTEGTPALTDWNMVFVTLIVNTFVLPTLLALACGSCWCLRPAKAAEVSDSSSD